MNVLLRRAFIALLFVLLVVALLKFQGKIFRPEHEIHPVPQPPPVPVDATIVKASLQALPESRTYPGFLEPVDPARIASRVVATVLDVSVREGDKVQAGDVLVVLDDKAARARLAQARANLQTAQAGALQAQLAFDRAQRLRDADALTPQEWEAARAQRDATQAMATQASDAVEEAQTGLDWYTLKAPFAGLVLRRSVDPGNLASTGQPLLELYQPDRLRFAVAVPEDLAASVEANQEWSVELQGQTHAARLLRILPASDPRTGTVTLHLELLGAKGLLPGLLGRLEIQVRRRQTLVIPSAAVRRVGQIERVQWVRDGKVTPITITTGAVHDGWVEVLTGLSAGEEVLLP